MTFIFNLIKNIWQQPPNSVVIYMNSKHVKCLINTIQREKKNETKPIKQKRLPILPMYFLRLYKCNFKPLSRTQ